MQLDGLGELIFCIQAQKSTHPESFETSYRVWAHFQYRQPMKTKIVRIGNSQGVRIPKALLEEAGLATEVELRVTARGLVLEPTGAVRSGWAKAAEAMAADVDEQADPYISTAFDDSEWEW